MRRNDNIWNNIMKITISNNDNNEIIMKIIAIIKINNIIIKW